MSIEIHSIQRIRQKIEDAFGTDESNSLGNFEDVPIVETAQLALNREMKDPETLQQRLDELPDKEPGQKRASLSFSINLSPTGITASDGIPQELSPLGTILQVGMGGVHHGTGSLVGASATQTVVPVDAIGDIGNGGTAVGLTSNSQYQIREIASNAGGDVNLKLETTASAPASGSTAHGCTTYYLTQDPQDSLQMVVEGYETDDRWVLLGGQLESMGFEQLSLGEIPRLSFTIQFADYLHEDDAAGSFSSTLADATYSNTEHILTEGDLHVPTNGESGVDGTQIHPISLTLSPGISYQPVPSLAGVNGILRWRRVRNKPVIGGDMQFPYENKDWFDARDNKTAKSFFLQLGTAAGEAFLISLPNIQITNVQRNDADSLAAQTVSFEAREDDQAIGGSNTDLLQSAFRVHSG